MNRRSRILLAGALAAGLAIGAVPAAQGAFHLMKIRSVFRAPAPTGAFVELQMFADGQNFVGGHQLKVCNSTGLLCSAFTIPGNVANGQSQRMILLGDTAAPGSPDFTLAGLGTSLTSNAGAGALCFDTVDCVSWGTFTGEANLASPAGTPIAGGLSGTMVSVRKITAGCTTALDEPDDTNVSNADFGFAVGYPMRNNSAAPTETLCPTQQPVTKKKKCKKKKRKGKKGSTAGVAAKKKCKKKKKN